VPISITVNYPAPAKACVAGKDFSLLLAANNTVWAWGSNNDGRLGTPSTGLPQKTPIQVPGVSGAVAIAAGDNFALALLGNGTVLAWGSNSFGQLGAGHLFTGAFPTPTTVEKAVGSTTSTLTDVVAIAAGAGHALALCSNGEVYSWGKDYTGQLGDGQASTSITPGNFARKIPNVSSVVAIAAGAEHSFLVRSNGSVLAFGAGMGGRLGTGTTLPSNATPAPVLGVSGVVAAAGGFEHSLFLTASGAVYGCGKNSNSRLGLPDPNTVYPSTLLSDAGSCAFATAGQSASWVIGVNGVPKVCGEGTAVGLNNPFVPVFTAITSLALGCPGGYQFFLSSVSGGVQMVIPCNSVTNAQAYPTTALFYGNVYSLNPVNGGPLAGQGNWFGLHVSPAELDAHANMALAGFDMVFGPLEPNGGASAVYPLYGANVSGITVWAVSIAFNPIGNILAASSAITSTTL
jgi:alpha-tubulin suppressor-like RCC1 family protein